MSIHTLQDYIQRVNNLQRGKPSPHKPFLLLIIIEMLESGELCENSISFREIQEKKAFFADLIAVFNSGNASDWKPSIHNPFFHLKTNGFWHLDPPELQSKSAATTPTPNQLFGAHASARVDESLFILLVMPEYRAILRQIILNTYFSNIRYEIEMVIEEYRIHRGEHIKQYSEQLIQDTQHPFSMQRDVASIQVETPVRSAGFRQAIMKIYKHTCAVCELNIRASSGESVTDAAHIVPFSVSYNDDVRNGMSLCKSHHWAFDAGLIAVSEDYRVVVSPAMTEQGPITSMLTGLRDREIWRPEEPEHCPAPEALTWHREQVMRQ